MCTDVGPDRLRLAGLILERVQKSKYNIGFQPTKIEYVILQQVDCTKYSYSSTLTLVGRTTLITYTLCPKKVVHQTHGDNFVNS